MGYDEYYQQQAGNGIVGYSGIRYQKGDGFFGRLISGAFLPWLRKSLGFIGKNALSAGVNIGSELLKNNDFSKENIKDTSKKHIKEQAGNMAKTLLTSLSNKQSGNGKKRKTKSKAKKVPKTKNTAKKTKKKVTKKAVRKKTTKTKSIKEKKPKRKVAIAAKDFLTV